MAGLGYRREMADWDMSTVAADFFEVAPENWIGRDTGPLHALIDAGRPVHLHGVSLNLGGQAPIDEVFLRDIRLLIDDLGATQYSDHLAASGDAHQLYDLFPMPFTEAEARRVADRIRRVQDCLGMQMAVENITWYTNIGELPEAAFVSSIVERADCRLLLDLNNISVNRKNHGTADLAEFMKAIDVDRISYLHVAGHEFDERFGLYLDTHSQPVAAPTREVALQLHRRHGTPILLEWDNDVPDLATINRELACLTPSTAM